MERLKERERITPVDYKYCVDLVIPGWGGSGDERLARKNVTTFLQKNNLADKILAFSIDGSRSGVINVSLFTNDVSLGASLRETPNAYTHFGADIRDEDNPIFLPADIWLKS